MALPEPYAGLAIVPVHLTEALSAFIFTNVKAACNVINEICP
jgi:hypothetical protein